MVMRERIADLAGIITTAAMVGVGYSLGGTIGAGVMAGIRINLSSSIIEHGSVKLKEHWVTSGDGIRNHDIQQALQRAVLKALTHLETRYFTRGQAQALPQDEQASIRELFRALQRQVQQEFPTHVERAIQEHQLDDYLYAPLDVARDTLWEQLNGPALLRTYDEDFRSFLRQHLLPEVQVWFGEELKTDSPACNKAWRAFQRMLLEGIQASVQDLQAGQNLLHQDVLQQLAALRGQLEAFPDHVRTELFLDALEKTMQEMRGMMRGIAGTTQRMEDKFDAFREDSKKDFRTVKKGLKTIQENLTRWGASPTGGPGWQPTAPVPAISEYFTGREADVQCVLDQLRDSRLVTLTGLGGIGKSEVAKAVGHAAQGQEWAADGVSYVDLQSATDVQAVMSALSIRLGLQPATTAEALAQQLGGRRLYILDDLYQALVSTRQEVRGLVRALHDYAAPARFFCTNREEVGLPGVEHPVPLGRLLPPHDAVLFRTLAEGSHYTWQEGDEERRETLLHDLQGYPLALTIAGSWLRDASLQTLLQQWERRRTAALKVPGVVAGDVDKFSSVEYSIALSFDHLPVGEARTLFTLFADLPAGATAEMVEAMLGDSGHEAVTLLRRRSLIEVSDGRYTMLVPVREFAARFRDDACLPFRAKLDAYLLALAEQWGTGDVWITGQGEAVRLLTTELPNLHVAMDRAHTRSDHHVLARVTTALSHFYAFALPSAEARQRLQDGIASARALGDQMGEADCLRGLGHVHRQRAEYDLAQGRYEEALPIYRSIGSRDNVAHTWWSMGKLHAAAGRQPEAISWMEQAARLFEEIGLTDWAITVQEEAEAQRRGETE